jgi:hypothetical protein
MVKSAQYRPYAVCIVGVFYGLATSAHAGLSALPKSHVQPMPDGRHMLVFLAPVPEANDAGKVARLPDGREVNLREAFPTSGYYEIGSTTPIWSAPWDDKDSWIVSDDGRFLVRLNRFGDGDYDFYSGGATSWGLTFYDGGKEIKNYDVSELVDFPSLMPLTTSDWHHRWYDDSGDDLAILDGQFSFNTSTHESYRFDVATGEIVEQFHLWRTVVRVAWPVLAVALLAVARLAIRWRRRAKADQQLGPARKTAERQTTVQELGKPYSFSLRSLLVATTIVAVLCLTIPRWPHVVLLAFFILAAVFFTRSTLRYCRRDSSALRGSRRKWGIGLRFAATATLWLSLYFLSAGPVLGFLSWRGAPEDVRMAVILTAYRPLTWIEDVKPDAFGPFLWYFHAWRGK